MFAAGKRSAFNSYSFKDFFYKYIYISLLVLSENIHWNSVSEWYKLLNIINGHTYLSHIRVYKYLNMIINTILRKKFKKR